MSGAYLMLFAMIFLGIMGAVNVILFKEKTDIESEERRLCVG